MTNAVIASLEENLKHIKLVAEPTVAAFGIDRGNTGDTRELTIQQFIGSYLTFDYQIKKGSIFSKGSNSQNIDCVVLFPNHPRLTTPIREIIIAEGVYAAIEVKPDIATLTEKSEFHRGLIQIQSVKQIERKVVQINFAAFGGRPKQPPYFERIPGIIFSFKSQELINVITYLKKVVREKILSDTELPDIIISIDKGILFYCPHIKETIFQPYLDSLCESYPDKIIVEIPEIGHRQLTWFLKLFLALPNPSIALSNPILYDYLVLEGNENIKFNTLYDTDNFVKHKIAIEKKDEIKSEDNIS